MPSSIAVVNRLNSCLLQVVGKAFDINEISPEASKYFETAYSLMDCLSPVYRQSFGASLAHKLEEIKRQQDEASGSGDLEDV
jgi:hypothetical protein